MAKEFPDNIVNCNNMLRIEWNSYSPQQQTTLIQQHYKVNIDRGSRREYNTTKQSGRWTPQIALYHLLQWNRRGTIAYMTALTILLCHIDGITAASNELSPWFTIFGQ